jgi:hypothetical protein
LEQPNGQPANANLYRSLKTPPFTVTAYLPQRANTNATSEPEVKLIFNADLGAGDAGQFLEFRDASGRSIPADVRQGTREEAPNRWQFEDSPSVGTWLREFTDRLHSGRFRRSGESPTQYDPTNEVSNLLIVTPHRPLFIGTGWKLVLGSGLPAADRRLRLSERSDIALGNVTLFTVGAPTAQNLIGAEPASNCRSQSGWPTCSRMIGRNGSRFILRRPT